MPNKSIQMNKLRTIIRLYEERTGLKTIAGMSGVSHTTVKKYIRRWQALNISYSTFAASQRFGVVCAVLCFGRVRCPYSPSASVRGFAFLPFVRSWAEKV